MRKLGLITLCFILVCFCIPNLFIKKIEQKLPIIDTSKTIRLLLTDTNETIEMSFNDYLKGVLIGEVPASYEVEALKAQAVVARTYTAYKMYYSPNAHENADMCDDINHCQAFLSKDYAYSKWADNEENEKWNKIEKAVLETDNEIITYNGSIINAFFHAHSGGKTEDAKFIWGREEIPYLRSVDSGESYKFEDEKSFTKQEFINMMKAKYSDYNEDTNITINSFTVSGRVDSLSIGNINLLGTDARTLFGLRSTFFEPKIEDDNIVFNTVGYGHGIGMSQEGANQMAKEGKKYREIIEHYYTGVKIEKLK
jgi:stage II sporulation protein D